MGSVKHICLPTPCRGIPMDKGFTQHISSDPKIKLEYHSSSLYLNILFVRNPHNLESLTALHNDHDQNWSKKGRKNTHTTTNHNNTRKRCKDKSVRTQWQSYNSKKRSNISRITQRRGRSVSEWCATLEVLRNWMETPWGPFYSPKGPRSHSSFIWKLHTFPLC
jgi:hypothetical protein